MINFLSMLKLSIPFISKDIRKLDKLKLRVKRMNKKLVQLDLTRSEDVATILFYRKN